MLEFRSLAQRSSFDVTVAPLVVEVSPKSRVRETAESDQRLEARHLQVFGEHLPDLLAVAPEVDIDNLLELHSTIREDCGDELRIVAVLQADRIRSHSGVRSQEECCRVTEVEPNVLTRDQADGSMDVRLHVVRARKSLQKGEHLLVGGNELLAERIEVVQRTADIVLLVGAEALPRSLVIPL